MTMTDYENIDFSKIIQEAEELAQATAEKRLRLEITKQQLAEAEATYRRLTREKNQMMDEIRADEQVQREMEKRKAQALRLQAAKEKRDAILARYNEQAAEMDALTATATWREFAFDHQIEGGKRLAIAERGILGDKRGLGKTLTSLIYLDMVQAKKILVIAPNDVVPQFQQEIQHWAPHRHILSFAGLNKDARSVVYPMLKLLDSYIITINYEAWRKDKTVIDDLVAAGLDTVILDEAHRAKSSEKQTAKGIFQIAFVPNYCPNCKTVGLDLSGESYVWMQNGKFKNVDPTETARCATCSTPLQTTVKNVLCMTGTPILNKPQELFTMLTLRDPFRFTSERQFLYDYCYSYAPGKWKFKTGGLERLTNSMSEFFVQRTREDAGITIPPPDIKIHYLEPDPVNYPNQYKAYRDLTQAAALVLQDGTAIDMLYILEIILRERQVITWPAGVELKIKDPDTKEVLETLRFDVEESQKLDAVEDLCRELAEEGERTIVFSKFKAPLYELKRRMQNEYKVTTATGDDPRFHKEAVRNDFDLKTATNDPRWNTVFCTFDAFATGVNLNAARHVIMIDDEWSPGMEDQAIGRIDRLNSTDQANVHIFRVKSTIVTFMEALIEQKRKLTEGFESTISAKDLMRIARQNNM